MEKNNLYKLLLAGAAALIVVGGSASAKAETHERVSVKPWKEKGKTVGVKVTLTLRPTIYTEVRVGLGNPGSLPNTNSYHVWRDAAAGVSGNYILHSFGKISGVNARTPKTVTLSVRYSKATKLKPGQPIEVVSAWRKSYWHIHGAKSPMYNQSVTYNLPKATRTAKAKTTKAKPKRVTKAKTTKAKPKRATKARTTKAKPKRVTKAKPKRATKAKPKRVTKAKPKRATKAKPKRVTKAKPKRTTKAKSKRVTKTKTTKAKGNRLAKVTPAKAKAKPAKTRAAAKSKAKPKRRRRRRAKRS